MPLQMNQSAVLVPAVENIPTPNTQGPFLPPIDKPSGITMKLVYYLTHRKFGKILGPLAIYSARLPAAFGMFYGKIGRLDKKLQLPREMIFLIREQVARLNICLFCVDIGRRFAIESSMDENKLDALDHYCDSPLFSDAERAALDYVTELTRDKHVQPTTFVRMSRFYSERAICEIVWLVASEHLYNLTNLGLNIHSDMLCDIIRKKKWQGQLQEHQ
jgi:alkylhydroperoxidase family enzyme